MAGIHSLLAGGALFLLLGASVAPAKPDDEEATRADFEFTAALLPYLPPDAVLHGPSGRGEMYEDVLRRLAEEAHRKEDLVALLTHPDARVRTLAAAVLFARGDPSVLPALVPLCTDRAATFDAAPPPAFTLANARHAPENRAQTVGEMAEAMVEAYLEPAGFHQGVKPAGKPGFAEYWEARRDRTFCAGWFAVALDRAVHDLVPTPADCVGAVRAVRRRIDALPPDERAWTLLWLHGETGSDVLATDDDLAAAARRLGTGKLLDALRGHFPGDDPDIRPDGGGGWRYWRMENWLLEHARAVFRPEDAPALLACAPHAGNAAARAGCIVAAARLRPAPEAVAILRPAMESFSDPNESAQRARLAAGWCELRGEADASLALDWFFQGLTDRGYEVSRLSFVQRVAAGPRARQTFAEIIRDPRFGGLPWEPLREIVRIVNAWSADPVVADDELRENIAQIKELAPAWREKLRASVPGWVEEPPGQGPARAE